MNVNFYDLIVAFHKKCPFHFKKEAGKNNRNGSNNLSENLKSSQFMPLLMSLCQVFKGRKKKKDALIKQTFPRQILCPSFRPVIPCGKHSDYFLFSQY